MHDNRWTCPGLVVFIVLMCVTRGWCQDGHASMEFPFLLETAVKAAGSGRAGFNLVYFPVASPSEPRFQPTKGLDSKDAVSFLVAVVRGEPNWTRDSLFGDTEGIYFHIARCYAALSLGAIGDQQAFQPLIEAIEKPNVPGRVSGNPREDRQQYILADYAILALGYLGDTRAIDPIIRDLPTLGQRYEYAAYALALLGDIRAANPLIQHASNMGKLDYRVHRCLEDLTHARFPVKYISGQRTYCVADFPELGELSADKVYLTLWQHWSRKGGEFAQKHAAEMYAVWNRRSEKGREGFGATSEKRLFEEMTRGGLASLPYIMERIEKGDGSLVSYVPQIVLPVRENPFKRSLTSQLPKGATRSECLEWWRNNSSKYRVNVTTEAGSDARPSEAKPQGTR